MAIQDGDKVKIDYTGKLQDGTVFDSSKHGDHSHPLEFEVGKQMIIKGLEDAVKGMEEGEEKTVNIPKDQAYGDRNEQMIADIPREKLPKDKEVNPGMMLLMATEDGKEMPAVVLEAGDESVKIDLDHPLAGKDLTFEFKIVGVNQESSEDPHDHSEEKEGSE